jgi:hypothetical protein
MTLQCVCPLRYLQKKGTLSINMINSYLRWGERSHFQSFQSDITTVGQKQELPLNQEGGWRPKNSSSALIASIISRFMLSALIVARPVAVNPTTCTPFHRKCFVHTC